MQDSSFRRLGMLLGVVAFMALAGGCKKQVASRPPAQTAPAPTAAQPTVTLNASPTSIKSGDAVTLSWTSTDATDLDIELHGHRRGRRFDEWRALFDRRIQCHRPQESHRIRDAISAGHRRLTREINRAV